MAAVFIEWTRSKTRKGLEDLSAIEFDRELPVSDPVQIHVGPGPPSPLDSQLESITSLSTTCRPETVSNPTVVYDLDEIDFVASFDAEVHLGISRAFDGRTHFGTVDSKIEADSIAGERESPTGPDGVEYIRTGQSVCEHRGHAFVPTSRKTAV
jgi:hypothetical protein